MNEFEPLTLALEGWFDSDLCDLPDTLRLRVEREFAPLPWDGLAAAQRRSVTLLRDYKRDPGMEQVRQSWWNFGERMNVVNAEIARWEESATPTAGELALREGRLKDLRQELEGMKLRESRSRIDYRPKVRKAATGDAPSSTQQDGPVQFIAYPKALHQLADRLGATPEEMAAWVFLGSDNGGLAAYRNANELNPPPRFAFPLGNYGEGGDDHDYLAPLMSCWFRADELDQFEPQHRYITGGSLIARWQDRPGLKPEAYILAKIHELRLSDLHPIYGFTQGTSSEEASSPPLISGLFKLSDVEQIEAEDFPVDWAQDLIPAGSLGSRAGQGVEPGAVVVESATAQAIEQPMEDAINLTVAQELGAAGAGAVSSENPCAIFQCMKNLRVDELTIAFVGDTADAELGANAMLEISARKTTRRVALAVLDLADRRQGGPNNLAVILLGMATGRRLSHSPANATKMKRLRNILRKAFGLTGDPFEPYRKTDGWVPHFKVVDKRGAAGERAKREAERRTEPYHEFVDRGEPLQQTHDSYRIFEDEDDEAGAFIKEKSRGNPA